MTSAQCRIFSQIAAESRRSCMGQTALLSGTTITIVCQPLDRSALEAGGFEVAGQMKALIYGATIPTKHSHLTIGSRVWVVKDVVTNLASVETALLLEAVPA